MTRKEVMQKIKEILAKDESLKDTKIIINFTDKRSNKPLNSKWRYSTYNINFILIFASSLHVQNHRGGMLFFYKTKLLKERWLGMLLSPLTCKLKGVTITVNLYHKKHNIESENKRL